MLYLLALVLPLTFLYSPKIEKAGPVYLSKGLTITQVRKTPAYFLYQQTQKKSQPSANFAALNVRGTSKLVDLNRQLSSENNSVAIIVQQNNQQQTQLRELASLEISRRDVINQLRQELLSQNHVEGFDSLFDHSTHQQASVITPMQGGAIIKGQFELKDGVGIVDHIVTLRRIFEGQMFELGRVDLRAGQYQIEVSSFEGELVAEIKDSTGLIIGEDRQKITRIQQQGSYFVGPFLKLGRPSAFSLNARSVDDEVLLSQGLQGSFFSKQYDLKKTTDIYPNVARHSSTVSHLVDPSAKLASVVSLRMAKDSADVVLFSQQWMIGAQKYLSEKLQIQYNSDAGIIIGRVMQNGKPLAGAQVVVENQPGVEPYYLNSLLIPEIDQSSTAENGYFILPAMNLGAYHINAFLKDRSLGSQLFVVETANQISYQEIISSSHPRSVLVRSFDAFQGTEQNADVFLPGRQDVLTTENGSGRYRTQQNSGLQQIQIRPLSGNYIYCDYLQNINKDYLHVPLIPEEFLSVSKAALQLETEPNTGVFIGFVPFDSYEVHIAGRIYDSKNRMFFDTQGRIVSEPVSGGGFVLFNLPTGLQEIIIQNPETERTFSQVVYVSEQRNYVAHFLE